MHRLFIFSYNILLTKGRKQDISSVISPLFDKFTRNNEYLFPSNSNNTNNTSSNYSNHYNNNNNNNNNN